METFPHALRAGIFDGQCVCVVRPHALSAPGCFARDRHNHGTGQAAFPTKKIKADRRASLAMTEKKREIARTLLCGHRRTSSTASGPPSPKGKAMARDTQRARCPAYGLFCKEFNNRRSDPSRAQDDKTIPLFSLPSVTRWDPASPSEKTKRSRIEPRSETRGRHRNTPRARRPAWN